MYGLPASASLMLDLASTTIADRQRSARERSQRALLRRTRPGRGAGTS